MAVLICKIIILSAIIMGIIAATLFVSSFFRKRKEGKKDEKWKEGLSPNQISLVEKVVAEGNLSTAKTDMEASGISSTAAIQYCEAAIKKLDAAKTIKKAAELGANAQKIKARTEDGFYKKSWAENYWPLVIVGLAILVIAMGKIGWIN